MAVASFGPSFHNASPDHSRSVLRAMVRKAMKKTMKKKKSNRLKPRPGRETWHFYGDKDKEYEYKRQGEVIQVWQCVARIVNPTKATRMKGKGKNKPRPARETWHFYGYAQGDADMDYMYKHNGKCTFVWQLVARIEKKKQKGRVPKQ